MSNDIRRFDDGNQFRPNEGIDSDLQKEIDDALGGMSIEDLMAQEQPAGQPAAQSSMEQGSIQKGTVASVQGDEILVEFGSKAQGILTADQFGDEDPLPQEGDTVEVTIERYDSREALYILSRKGAVLAATWDTLQPGKNVEGRVTGHNKGGLELTLNGINAFMPVSQIERFGGVEDMAQYVGQKLPCQVVEVDRGKDKVVVSRRKLLDQQAEVQREQMFETLQEGQTVTGTVRNIMPYGAFVDIGGADGLLHVREMAHSRVEKPEDFVSIGQEVTVVVVKIDRENKKIGLSLKQATPDPWQSVGARFPVGDQVTGRVTKLMDFGAFIELEEGVEALVPISELRYGKRVGHPKEVVSEGDVVKGVVLRVEPERKRMSVSLKQTGDDPWMGASARWPVDSVVEGTVTRTADFGAFVELAAGVEGLIHISELSEQRVRTVGDVVRPGDTVKAKILEVDEERQRISMSIKKLTDQSETYEMPSQEELAEALGKSESKKDRPRKGGLDVGGPLIPPDLLGKLKD